MISPRNQSIAEAALAVISFSTICLIYLLWFPGGLKPEDVSAGIYIPVIYILAGVLGPMLLFGWRDYAEKYGYKRSGLAKSALIGGILALPLFVVGYTFAVGAVPPLLLWYVLNVLEETYFRGLWQRVGAHLAGTWGAIVVPAVLFGLYHIVAAGFTPLQALFPFSLGLLSGWLRKDTDNMLGPILLHMALVTGMWFAPR